MLNRIKRQMLFSVLALVTGIGIAPQAYANLIGTDVNVSIVVFNDPVLSVPFSTTVTVTDPGIELPGLSGGSFDVDISADTFRIDVLVAGPLDAADFLGFLFEALELDIVGFAAADSNIAGVDNSRLIFDINAIGFNLQGLDLEAGDFIEATVQFAQRVPAPSSLVLLLAGFALLARAQRRTSAAV